MAVTDVRLGLAIALSLVLLMASTATRAHIVMGSKSLHLRVAESDLVVRARIVDPKAIFVSQDGRKKRGLVEVRILETLKGKTDAETIRFAQDGHDVVLYRVGQETLVFLTPISRSRELRALAVPGGPSHVSSQERGEAFLFEAPHSEVLLAAVRAYAESESAGTRSERIALIRQATLALLNSGDSRLGATALASLVLSPNAALLVPADLPRLEKTLADATLSIGFRAGLLAELERRGLVDGPPRWLALLENAQASELKLAVRAAGAHPSDEVQAFLLDLLAKGDAEIAAEAAMALGRPGNTAAVGPLSVALAEDQPRLRNAAIRGLGGIGGPEALQVLENAGRTHPDPATRRRARAAANLAAAQNTSASSTSMTR